MATTQRVIQVRPGQTLLLSWTGHFSQMHVYENNQLLKAFETLEELNLGQPLQLSDKQYITIIVAPPHGLEVWYQNRELISGTVSGEINFFRRATNTLLVIGGIQLVIGVLLGRHYLQQNGLSFFSFLPAIVQVVQGGFFVGLGTWAHLTNDKRALYGGLVVGVAALVLAFGFGFAWEIILLGFLLYNLYQGVKSAVQPRPTARQDDELLDSDLVH
jgi:hypothetical protein